MANEFMTLQGKQIPYVRVTIQVADALLDPKNPRIQYMIGQRSGDVSQSDLDGMLWEKDQVKALAASIYQNGGVYEPIIVQRQGNKYLVREGNSRTVACRHLTQQYPNDARFMTMPAVVFDVDLGEDDLAVLLADMHVASKIRWDAYEQAKHVYDLHHIHGKTYEWLSNHLRLSKSKITELLDAYRATTEYLMVHKAPDNIRKFSFFQELTKKKELRARFADDSEFKQQFFRWLATNKITDSKQVRSLDAVLAHPEAAQALEAQGFAGATRVLIVNDPALESDLFLAIKRATEALKQAPASDITDLKTGNVQKLLMLRNLHRAIEDLATLSAVKL